MGKLVLHNVWILLKSGICIFHKEYRSIHLDENLVSGFLSATSSFVSKLGEEKIESITMGKKKFVCTGSNDLIFSICVDKDDEDQDAFEKLWEIKITFLRKYLEKVKSWDGDVSVYRSFGEDLDKLVFEKTKISNAVKELIQKLKNQKDGILN